MISYPHFAAQNLFLKNGYAQEESEYGELLSYMDEDSLEACIRLIVAVTPKRLNGPKLRFLRRGLDLSQEAFGEFVDRDTQTIARLEKSDNPIPQAIDLAIRSRFLARFKPCMPIGEILSIHDLKVRFPNDRIIFSHDDGKWSYHFDIPKIKIFFTDSQTSETECLIDDIADDGIVYQRRLRIQATEEGVLTGDFDTKNDFITPPHPSYNMRTYAKIQ